MICPRFVFFWKPGPFIENQVTFMDKSNYPDKYKILDITEDEYI